MLKTHWLISDPEYSDKIFVVTALNKRHALMMGAKLFNLLEDETEFFIKEARAVSLTNQQIKVLDLNRIS